VVYWSTWPVLFEPLSYPTLYFREVPELPDYNRVERPSEQIWQKSMTKAPKNVGRDAPWSTDIQKKQGGHHLLSTDDTLPLDDTDRNTDKIIKPSQQKPAGGPA
jgi:hypothetical protein